MKFIFCLVFSLQLSLLSLSQNQSIRTPSEDSTWIVNNYYKIERMIPMRDGVRLFTSIYIPKDSTKKHPIMMNRTPYSCSPYGENKIKPFWERNTKIYLKEKYIMVFQDVRGRYMSEGVFEDVRPYINDKKTNKDIDEASDTYDAIDWLVKNVPSSNGNVGVSGISYPGFYSTMAALSGHPALKAVSPQAPVTDWFRGDDFHHNGVFFLLDCFDFDQSFGVPRPKPTTIDAKDFSYPTPDNYDFFLREGSLKSMTRKYKGDTMKFWNEVMEHPTYDAFWKSRTPLPHLTNVKPAILTTGGIFDAEDEWGTWNTYKAIEKQNPGAVNKICVGPWFHGGWARSDGSKLGNIQFEGLTSEYYYKNIELPFFNHYLNPEIVSIDSKSFSPELLLPEATVFFTGENKWKKFTQWPPNNVELQTLYLNEGGVLKFVKPISINGYSDYISDPGNPVPYTEDVHTNRTREYMTDDQRFASRRPDVLVFTTDILKEDITLAGPVIANLMTSISTTDADFVVKLIDVFPDNFTYPDSLKVKYPMGGYQMLVRGEIIRGKFRNSLEAPEPFVPHKITQVKYELPDVAHTFKKGHRLMIQIQSS